MNFKPEKDREREEKKEAGNKEHIVDLLLYIRRRATRLHGIINFIAPPRLMNRRKKRETPADSGVEKRRDERQDGKRKEDKPLRESNKRTKDAAAAVTTEL